MHKGVVAATLAVAVMAVTACASAEPATLAPGANPPSSEAPIQTPVGTPRPASEKCTGIPTMEPGNVDSIPKFSPDPALAPVFPNVFGGMAPGITFGRWMDAACVFGGETVVQDYVARLPNVDFETLMWANAFDTSETSFDSIQLAALRTPGHDADELSGLFLPLVFGAVGSEPDEFVYTQSSAIVGGKNVTLWTDTNNGEVTYAYVSGDTIYGLTKATRDVAETVFAEFP